MRGISANQQFSSQDRLSVLLPKDEDQMLNKLRAFQHV